MNTDKEKKNKSWQEIQDEMSGQSGLAIALIKDASLKTISKSNNNSICESLTSSKEFAPQCQKFCGEVYNQVNKSKKAVKYKCHAGLECVGVPVKNADNQNLVAITGRTFVKSEDYRKATERAISGDWSKFPSTMFFENVLITSSTQSLESLAKDLMSLSEEERKVLPNISEKLEKPKPQKKKVEPNKKIEAKPTEKSKKQIQNLHPSVIKEKPPKQTKKEVPEKIEDDSQQKSKTDEMFVQKNLDELKELAEWRSLFNSLLNLEYKNASHSILEFIKQRYGISSLAWLENYDNKLQKVLAIGKLKTQEIQISVPMDDERLLKILRRESSIELKERNKTKHGLNSPKIRLFPISVSGEIRSALLVGEKTDDKKLRQSLVKFCQTVASELEILRLREELSRRSWLDIALQKFNESLKMIDSEDFWSRLMQTTAELLQAERGSLLVYDENEDKLIAKSAIGRKSDFIKKMKSNVGNKVARKVWESGEPLVVPSIRKTSVQPAPSDWKYKTESFISYPIAIGERKIGVLNIADKADGSAYKEFDVQLLKSIIPQIAVAIDHATLKNKAGEFEQLSVTDTLTGLLNRRYLEQRLEEEIKRSNRHGYPMSFMMIDVDDFKSYNDKFLHPEGDKALQIVGQCLRETLRGADIAARYGGEEFSILLPQTTLDEAEIIAERIRTNIATTQFPNRQVTVSIGIACVSLTLDTVEELVESADKALFEAKKKGKNNVQIFRDQIKELRLPN